MRVQVACEESQEVCKAFRKRGHEAYSCDIQECSGGHPEWHIMGDALALINGRCTFKTMDGEKHEIDGTWDLLIAHPPCTYLTNAGARHLFAGGVLNKERFEKGLEAKAFFMSFYHADCPRIAIENPVASKVYELPLYSQIIQPYEYGHPHTKKTCLWLKGLEKLEPTDIVEPIKGKRFQQKKRKLAVFVLGNGVQTRKRQGERKIKNIPGNCPCNGGAMGMRGVDLDDE